MFEKEGKQTEKAFGSHLPPATVAPPQPMERDRKPVLAQPISQSDWHPSKFPFPTD